MAAQTQSWLVVTDFGNLTTGSSTVEAASLLKGCGILWVKSQKFNSLTPNDLYMSRTATLTSKPFILYIYSTNVGTEYFKHALYSPFFLFKMQFVS